ncbi:LOW QUALITY PROTEIN: sp110 nuclear body protein [Peromyscus eremicus]|uniref:LOW QUALITY PROTEIN: sp110 nuclear body protein n=1 Tax=Peromyscus eremicus TaxID=42410 RepID=UPI0027DC7608|nr:LOW QUALITY PROTEIN: sp110 nuclear body protein [Peromyscus eremicus]
MFTVPKALERALLQHFVCKKLDIAYAINKPFPFFEALRDNSFITDRVYKESLEACQNLVPLSKVVHNVLNSLERTFCLSMLVTLFSPVNLHEYPSLSAISRSFKNVVTAYGGNKRPAQTVLKASTNPAEGCSFQTLQPLPPPQLSSPSHLSSAPRFCEPRASSQQIIEILDEQSSPSHPAVPPPGFIQKGKTTPASSRDPQRNDKDDSPEMPQSPSGPMPVIKDSLTPETKEEEDSGGQPPGSPGTVQVVKDDSPAPNDQEMPQKAPSTPANKKAKKRKGCIWSAPKRRCPKKRLPQGVASPGHGVQKKPKVVGQRIQRKDDSTRNLEMVTRAQKARTKRAQTSRSQEISNGASKTNGRKKPQKMPSKPPRTTQGKPKDDTEDFLSPTLPVTCGKAKGILFKEKMKQGTSEKCIQNEAGDWFTPKEFLIEGERAKSKDWKKTIRCKAKTLRFLEKDVLLFIQIAAVLSTEQWETGAEVPSCGSLG